MQRYILFRNICIIIRTFFVFFSTDNLIQKIVILEYEQL